jgi:hypothetical protein
LGEGEVGKGGREFFYGYCIVVPKGEGGNRGRERVERRIGL